MELSIAFMDMTNEGRSKGQKSILFLFSSNFIRSTSCGYTNRNSPRQKKKYNIFIIINNLNNLKTNTGPQQGVNSAG